MARHAAELFIQCVYSLELSYDDLLALEGDLKVALTDILEQNGGDFIQFEETGDIMRVQCLFPEYKDALFHNVCDKIAPLMNGRVEARLLFVDRNLDSIHFAAVSKGKWKEGEVQLPAAGPLSKALRDKDPVRKKKKKQ